MKSDQADAGPRSKREKLLEVEKQITADASMVRQMTPDERKRNPVRPARPKRY